MHAMASSTIRPAPNGSTPVGVRAGGVFVAPANSATNPIAASNGPGTPRSCPSAAPRVAPITNSGVTSPPWTPEPDVRDVTAAWREGPAGDGAAHGDALADERQRQTEMVAAADQVGQAVTSTPPTSGRAGAQRTVERNTGPLDVEIQASVRRWVLAAANRYNNGQHWSHPAPRRGFPPPTVGLPASED